MDDVDSNVTDCDLEAWDMLRHRVTLSPGLDCKTAAAAVGSVLDVGRDNSHSVVGNVP